MPWTCQCPLELNDDVSTCATCGASKSSWTLNIDQTRVLKISASLTRLEAHRGLGADNLAADDPGNVGFETEQTAVCPVLPKARLLALLERGELPAPAHRLVGRVWPRKRDRTVTLTVDLAWAEAPEHEVDGEDLELSAQGSFDVVYVCVHGPEDTSTVELPGTRLIDVSDDTATGFAEGLELEAVGKTVELTTEEVGVPRVRLLEVEDICFATGREVLFPGGWSRSDETTGLSVVAGALEYARKHPDRRLLIAGHTDTKGSVSSNEVLSADRARNVLLYLTGQKEAWAAHSQGHFEVADLQSILKWIDFMFEWDCDPGDVDGDWGQGSKKARDAFRRRYNEEYSGSLEEGAKQSEADWCAFFDLYEVELAAKLATTADNLAGLRSGLKLCEPATLACSEHWATQRPGAPDSDAANRRVDVLFFDPGEVPALPGSPPGEPIYGEGNFAREYLSVDDAFLEVEPPYGDAPFEEVCSYVQRHSARAGA